jgi:uncharacterized Zn finger protein
MTLYDWLTCPECGNESPHVTDNYGDRGGVESLIINCDKCGYIETVTP